MFLNTYIYIYYKRKEKEHFRTYNLYTTCNLIFLIAAAMIVTSLFEKDSI